MISRCLGRALLKLNPERNLDDLRRAFSEHGTQVCPHNWDVLLATRRLGGAIPGRLAEKSEEASPVMCPGEARLEWEVRRRRIVAIRRPGVWGASSGAYRSSLQHSDSCTLTHSHCNAATRLLDPVQGVEGEEDLGGDDVDVAGGGGRELGRRDVLVEHEVGGSLARPDRPLHDDPAVVRDLGLVVSQVLSLEAQEGHAELVEGRELVLLHLHHGHPRGAE